jgi:hypothetical protein
MPEPTSGQSGGIVVTGTMNTGGGDAVGRDKTTTTTTTYYSPTESIMPGSQSPMPSGLRHP